jgi:hypothetical protein
MARTLFTPMIEHMNNAKQITIKLQLELDGDSLHGEARTGSGSSRTFSSWLGLIGALDMLVGDGASPDGGEQARPGSVRQAR